MDETFDERVRKYLADFSHKDVRFFVWLCAVRTLPFLGTNGDFDYWKHTKKGDKRQKHLLAVLNAIDIPITYATTYTATYVNDIATKADAAANAATKSVFTEYDINRVSYSPTYADVAVAKTDISKYDIDSDYVSYSPTYADVAVAKAEDTAYVAAKVAYVAAKAAYTAIKPDLAYVASIAKIVTGDAADYATIPPFNLLQSILFDDLESIKSGKRNFQNNTSMYGVIWDNFQKTLRDLGCDYWGDWYTRLFTKGFVLDEADRKEIKLRLNVSDEIKAQGAEAVAKFLDASNTQNERNLELYRDNSAVQLDKWKLPHGKSYNVLFKDDTYIPLKIKDANSEYVVEDILTKLKEKECPHAILIGEGGLGKTATCMRLWAICLKQNMQVFYVPLCDYTTKNTIKKNIVEVYGVAEHKYDYLMDEKSVVLLLDGFNEIQFEYKKIFLEELRKLAMKKRLQILITSRNDVLQSEISSFTRLTFEPINEKVIDAWLAKHAPTDKKRVLTPELYAILNNPMMLKIYTLNIKEPEAFVGLQKTRFLKDPSTTGELLWNFLEHQIIKTKILYQDPVEEGFAKILFRHLLPYIAYQVESHGKFHFTVVELEHYINNFCTSIKYEGKKSEDLILYKSVIQNILNKHDRTSYLLDRCINSFSIMKRGIDRFNESTYAFTHKSVQELFSATHIKNQMRIGNKSVFTDRVLPFEISRMLLEILQEHKVVKMSARKYEWVKPSGEESELRKYLECFKNMVGGEAQIGVFNALQIIDYTRNGDLSEEDFSELDLRRCSFVGKDISSSNFARSFMPNQFEKSNARDTNFSEAFFDSQYFLVSASEDGSVNIWDSGNGKLVHTLHDHTDAVYGVCSSPDGKYLASASGDKTIKIWESETYKLVCTLSAHTNAVMSVCFSPDGKYLASASRDKSVKVWETETRELLHTISDHIDAVYGVCFSPDGKYLASASGDKTIKIWESENWTLLHTLSRHTGAVVGVCFSPDGKYLASASRDKSINIWDWKNDQLLHNLYNRTNSVHSVCFSPDGKYLASASGDKTIKIWESETYKLVHTLHGHTDAICCVCFSPNGEHLTSTSYDGTVRIWDSKRGKIEFILKGHTSYVYNVCFMNRVSDTVHCFEFESNDTSKPSILWFNDVKNVDASVVGGKNANLCEMMRIGLRVPTGFAVTTSVYERFIEETRLSERINGIIKKTITDHNDPKQCEEASKYIRKSFTMTPMPKDIQTSIRTAYRKLSNHILLKDAFVAVISSATAENLPDISLTDNKETWLNIKGANELIEKIVKCWSSLFTPSAISYREDKKMAHSKVSISVGVHKMVNSRAGGVMTTLNPITGNQNEIVIKGSFGLGVATVSGAVTPDVFIVDKLTGQIKERNIANKTGEYIRDPNTGKTMHSNIQGDRAQESCVSDKEIFALVELANKVEKHYGKPTDIEWAIDQDLPYPDNIFLIQVRPSSITVEPTTPPEHVDNESFRKQVQSGLSWFSSEDVCFFAWLCAVRALPFIGANKHFNYWKNTDKNNKRQKHLLAVLKTIDSARPDDTYGYAFDAGKNAVLTAETVKTINIDVKFCGYINNYAFDIAEHAVNAAINAANTLVYATNAYGISVATEHAVNAAQHAVNAAINATVINYGYQNVDELQRILLDDVSNIQNRKYNFKKGVGVYGVVWDNFQGALRELGCGYWGDWYAKLFEKGFILDDDDREEIKLRLSVPNEIMERGAADVARYVMEIKNQGSVRLNEARVIILGDKGSGKTALTWRLKNPTAQMPEIGESTEGVDVIDWVIPVDSQQSNSKLNVHVWDFAGHIITHAVHRCFMSERCLYILVIDGRTEGDNRTEYWLEQIRNYGGDSPVFILVNVRDKHRVDLPENTLKKEFPSIIDFCYVDINTGGEVLEIFRQKVMDYLRDNPLWKNQKISLPAYKVKETLRKNFAQGNNFITRDDFDQIAKNNGVTSEEQMRQLLEDLHALGICLHYGTEDMQEFGVMVLNPNWISHGIYRLINWGLNEKRVDRYKISISDFHKMFADSDASKYPEEKAVFLFSLMKIYQLAFFINPKAKNFDEILVPLLLPADRPDASRLPVFDFGEGLLMEYQANQPLPPYSVARLAVLHSKELDMERSWRFGAVLRWEDTDALVEEREYARSVTISVRGSKQVEYIERLRETLDSIFSEYTINIEVVDKSVTYDNLLQTFNEHMRNFDYPNAFVFLPKLENVNKNRYSKLVEDFAYVFDPTKSLEINEKNWSSDKKSIDFKVNLWSLLTFDLSKSFETQTKTAPASTKNIETKTTAQEIVPPQPAVIIPPDSQVIGETLEKYVMILLKKLFIIDDEEGDQLLTTLTKQRGKLEKKQGLIELRRQQAGYQFGFDIQFTYTDASGSKCVCMMECKDTKNITRTVVMDKLEQARQNGITIHQWVLISPNGKVSNDLHINLKKWEEENRWDPIQKVQLWTRDNKAQDNNVEEFFGLVSDIHKHYYGSYADKIALSTWDDEKRSRVLETWKQKLEPAVPLPKTWKDYLRNYDKLLTSSEKGDPNKESSTQTAETYYEERYEHRVPIICRDINYNFKNDSAEQHLINWTKTSSNGSILFLLGDFGDGKTFLTYSLARQLAKDFLKSPSKEVIPLRLTLKDLTEKMNEETFLVSRLAAFGATLSEWNDIRNKFKLLIILDGFDEMSPSMGKRAMDANIDRLRSCINYYKGKDLKIIITSRATFFNEAEQALRTQITQPFEVVRLHHIDPAEKIKHLSLFAKKSGPKAEKHFELLCKTYDILGLASKPLLLEMMKDLILRGEIKEVDSLPMLYDLYTEPMLKRKETDQYRHPDSPSTVAKQAIGNLEIILEDFAITSCIHTNGATLNDLTTEFKEKYTDDISLTKALWNDLINPSSEEVVGDTKNRVLCRSILQEVKNEGCYVFFHRSMREYFAARGICRLLEENSEKAGEFLSKLELTPETFKFAGQKLSPPLAQLSQNELDKINIRSDKVKHSLVSLIEKTRNTSQSDKESQSYKEIARLGATAVTLHFITWGLPDIDWRNLVLDNASLPDADFTEKDSNNTLIRGKDLSNTSFRYAVLDNADLNKTILTNCDFTGVQFDETKDIYTMKKADIEDKPYLYVFYSGGKLRKWDIFEKISTEITTLESVEAHAKLSAPDVGLLFFQKERIFFTHNKEKSMQLCGGVNLDNDTNVLDFRDKKVLFAINKQLLFFDLAGKNNSGIFENGSVTEQSKGTIMDDTAAIVFNDHIGPRIITKHGEQYFSDFLDAQNIKDVTAISTIPDVVNGTFIMCVGDMTGHLIVCRVKNMNSDKVDSPNFTIEKIANYSGGDKSVKNVCCWDTNHVLYTGTDGIIHVLELKDNKVLELHSLKLIVKCSGAKINDVQQGVQRNKLKEYGGVEQ
ncbi:MAG: NACHT domain-containing protein [Oscillospiraceae bacterium]|nr:NACHT domain-containing protein [Oscillospiraceae bacterium]